MGGWGGILFALHCFYPRFPFTLLRSGYAIQLSSRVHDVIQANQSHLATWESSIEKLEKTSQVTSNTFGHKSEKYTQLVNHIAHSLCDKYCNMQQMSTQHQLWAIYLSSHKKHRFTKEKNAINIQTWLKSCNLFVSFLSNPRADGRNRGKYSETKLLIKENCWRETGFVKNSNPLRWNIPPSPLPLHCFVKDTEARQGPWQAPTLRELRADPVSWVTLIDGNWPPVVIVPVPLCRLMFRIKVGEPRKQRDRLEKIKSRRERKKPQNYRLCFKCSSFSLLQNQVLSDIQTHSNIIGQDWE